MQNVSTSRKLIIGFGLLIFLTLLTIGISFYASNEAIRAINRVDSVRVPALLHTTQAQAHVFTMFANVRGYLALSDNAFIESYHQSETQFAADVQKLHAFIPTLSHEDQTRVQQLNTLFTEWQALPPKLFALHEDPMQREPAYAWVNTTGTTLVGKMLFDTNTLIEQQAEREPTAENIILLKHIAQFQRTLAALFSGVRGYVTTQNPNYRYYEYETNRTLNNNQWHNLEQQRNQFTPVQQQLFDSIANNRQQFFELVDDNALSVIQTPTWRTDLHLFRSEADPLMQRMLVLLEELNLSQQQL